MVVAAEPIATKLKTTQRDTILVCCVPIWGACNFVYELLRATAVVVNRKFVTLNQA